jgi:hypothetical protein
LTGTGWRLSRQPERVFMAFCKVFGLLSRFSKMLVFAEKSRIFRDNRQSRRFFSKFVL